MYLFKYSLSLLVGAYILKAGFAGFLKPQIIFNFLQKDWLTTQKLSSLYCFDADTAISP